MWSHGWYTSRLATSLHAQAAAPHATDSAASHSGARPMRTAAACATSAEPSAAAAATALAKKPTIRSARALRSACPVQADCQAGGTISQSIINRGKPVSFDGTQQVWPECISETALLHHADTSNSGAKLGW